MKPIWRQRLGALAGKTGAAFMDDIGVAGLLCAAAGFADAVGYVNSGVFAANMTGNTVLAGLALAGGHWDIACIGVVLASFILRLLRERTVVPLIGEVAFILAAAFIEPSATL